MNLKITFIFFILPLLTFSQGKIIGNLNLLDSENKKEVAEQLFVILKSRKDKTILDSVKVDKELGFVFEDIKEDSVQVFFSLRNYPTDRSYIITLAEGETKNVAFDFRSTCPYSERKTKCPTCHKKDAVIPISYGLTFQIKMVGKDGKEKKSKKKNRAKEGGCVVSDCQPYWYCERDELEF